MTEEVLVQSISVNLLRLAEWYYVDPVGNKAVCERYLRQSKQLAGTVTNPALKSYMNQVHQLSFVQAEDPHAAERFLTLGVLLQ